jgi:Ca2+-binding RTX toxin-like protein
MIHTLESRRLLSASVGFEPASGLLWIAGSDKPDQIEVAVGKNPLAHVNDVNGLRVNKQITPGNEGAYVNVFDSGRLVYQNFLPGKTLRDIHLIGNGGDDTLLSCNFESTVTVRVFGEGDDDRIDAVHFGPTSATEVFGGQGNDAIRVAASINASTGFAVWGDDGDDIIFGSSLNDTLRGDGDDMVERPTAGGSDVIYGGDGDDFICGGDGDDALFGQDGNDWLEGCGGSDQLDGGNGEDAGTYDLLDKLITNIEKLTQTT